MMKAFNESVLSFQMMMTPRVRIGLMRVRGGATRHINPHKHKGIRTGGGEAKTGQSQK